MKLPNTKALGAFVLAMVIPLPAFAETAQPPANHSINLAWALRQAEQYNPRLQAFPFYVRQAEGQKSQADLSPNPNLEFSVENVLGRDAYQDGGSAETSLLLSQTIELGAKRTRRIAYADTAIAQRQAEYEIARLDVLAETGRRYYQVIYSQALSEWIERRAVQESRALKTVRQRARAGSVLQADVSKMVLRLAQSKALAAQLQDQQVVAKAELAAMWLAVGDFQLAEGSFSSLPGIPDRQLLLDSLPQSPRWLASVVAEQMSAAKLRLAQANGRSDLTLGLGLRRFEASRDQALVFNASMPLAWQNPRRGDIASAKAANELSQQQHLWAMRDLQLTLQQSLLQLQSLKRHSQRLQQQLLPKAHKLLRDTENGYQRGRVSVLQWADAQADLFQLQRQLIDSQSQLFSQLLELESITGQALTGQPSSRERRSEK